MKKLPVKESKSGWIPIFFGVIFSKEILANQIPPRNIDQLEGDNEKAAWTPVLTSFALFSILGIYV